MGHSNMGREPNVHKVLGLSNMKADQNEQVGKKVTWKK